ncbi:MAG: M2 family metallopeptidase, partial [Methylocystaceae bacterium]
NQGDKAQINLIINKQIAIEKKFAVYRPHWRDQQVSNQFLKHILDTTYNEEELAAAWRAGGQIGEVVGPDLLELVKLRNKMARQQGYANYFQQQLYLNEQSEAQLNAIFKQVDNLTRQPYQAYKQEMDQVLAERYSIPIQQLKPWHYQQIFLQQAPLTCEAKLDNYYEQTDVIKVVKRYFKDLGLSGDKIIAASDLKPRRQKYPYAYCIDIDRNKDIRILANLQNDSDSAQTLLHEMGHAVYDANIAPSLPWRLREPASIGLTEGVAMMFGDMYSDPDWLQRNLGLTVSESQSMAAVCRHTAQLNELIFCRWALVMYEFEKELYANPGSHLDRYWWQLVEHYQLITPPAETPPYIWAAKVHLATAPVYYYQYVLGRIIASQLGNGWHQELTAPHPKNQHFGVYLKECVFAPGARYPWVQILQGATGQKLEPRSLLKDWGNK